MVGAGALKGQKGDNGKSAYELAVKNGYTGTEQQWVASLSGKNGKDGYTPTIGANGNWFINGVDTNIPGKAVRSYNELEDKPNIPSKTSDLTNDSNYITANDIPTKLSNFTNDSQFITLNDIPKNISNFTNDSGYLKLIDLQDYAKKVEIPTKISQLTNDKNYLTSHQQIKTINNQSLVGTGNITISNAVDDVQVNGISILNNKIANVIIPELSSEIGHTFTTNITVGHLEAGTFINKTMTVAEILYKILYTDTIDVDGFNLYWGGLEDPNQGLTGLDHAEQDLGIAPDDLIGSRTVVIKAGNPITEEGEYPSVILSKGSRNIQLTKWVSVGAEGIPYNINVIEKEDYTIYYLIPPNYTEDTGGASFILTFSEVE